MEPSFETAAVRDLCEVREVAVAALGDAAAKDLAARLSEAAASNNFADFQLLLDEQLVLNADGSYVLALSTGWRVVGRAGGAIIPTTPDGMTDWGSVTRMRIVSIEPLS